jgi:predicted Rossmann fold nucleotide-binding protein DprA/Smf involved in DNA uptake
MKQISVEPTHIDEVYRSRVLLISTISSTLSIMESKGLVKLVGTMNYALVKETREEYKVKIE